MSTTYINDSFWGYKSLRKMRLRKIIEGSSVMYEASCKYRTSTENHITTVVNDIIYRGESRDNAISAIKIIDVRYNKENSYECVRFTYTISSCSVLVVIYPFGSFVKILGENDEVLKVMKSVNCLQSKNIKKCSDDIYLDWQARHGFVEQFNVKFGLDDL